MKLKNKPFTSQLLGSYQDRLDAFLFMQLYENGSLGNIIEKRGPFNLKNAQKVIVDVLLGLQEMHRINILHGDIKPDNILIDTNGRAYVADFGLCRNFKEDPVKGMYGTPTYQSPEQYSNKYFLDERVDIFNTGIVFFEMLTGKHPFITSNDPNDVAKNIVSVKFQMPTLQCDPAISFINKTLCEASRRLNVNNVLQHPFIPPMIFAARTSFEWPKKIFNMQNYPTCFTSKNLQDITGIPKGTESIHIAEVKVSC